MKSVVVVNNDFKLWFELGIEWVSVLAFGENCSEICSYFTTCCKAHVYWRYLKRKRQTSELYSHSQFSHIYCQRKQKM